MKFVASEAKSELLTRAVLTSLKTDDLEICSSLWAGGG